MKLAGKAVVVTGAGSGIGRQVALQALGRGAKVAGVDLRQEGLDATAELAAEVTELAMFQADVTDRAAIEALPAGITDAIAIPRRWPSIEKPNMSAMPTAAAPAAIQVRRGT